MLRRLDPTDLALVRRVNSGLRAAVEAASNLPRTGAVEVEVEVLLMTKHFSQSVELQAWAKENGCPWTVMTMARAAEEGSLEVVKWARARGCPWQEFTCEPPLRAGTWRCCGGCGRTGARGVWGRADSPLNAGTWRY